MDFALQYELDEALEMGENDEDSDEKTSDESPLVFSLDSGYGEDSKWGSESDSYDERLEAHLAQERGDALELELAKDHIKFKRQRNPKPGLSPDMAKLVRSTANEARERLEAAARTPEDFNNIISIWDRMDQNRARRERYHEVLRGDVPLEQGKAYDGMIFPRWLTSPAYRQLTSGSVLDILFNCPHEMHELTSDAFISGMVYDLKEEHKELLYYLAVRLYSSSRLAAVRGQTDRNIRKVRATMMKKLRTKLYERLTNKQKRNLSLTLREREFLQRYHAAALDTEEIG